jgi:tRNA (guanine-N7-)-methyltransferase
MVRKKLRRFQENRESGVVIEPGTPLYHTIRGQWNSAFFRSEHPITVELGCGRGEYSIGLARLFPDRHLIGIDVKGARIWKGMRAVVEENLRNVAFLRAQVDHLEQFFAPGEIREIWIPFPDPRPKCSDENKRLSGKKFLEIYRKLLAPGGWVHLKTDNTGLFDYSVELAHSLHFVDGIEYTYDLYNSGLLAEHYGIRTRYEHDFMQRGLTIKYLKFRIM